MLDYILLFMIIIIIIIMIATRPKFTDFNLKCQSVVI